MEKFWEVSFQLLKLENTKNICTVFSSNACKYMNRPHQGTTTEKGHVPDKEDRITHSL